jgi:hypothetical protein
MIRNLIHKITGRKDSFTNPVVNPDCTEFEINNWLLSDFILKKIVPVVGVHPYPLNELILMIGAMCRFAPDHLFEWGTHRGVSARIFYETRKAFNIKTIIHTIDLPPNAQHVEHPGQEHARLVRDLPEVKIYRGDGLETALQLASELAPSARLMFFVDGDHSYQSVYRELSGIIERFPRAIILLHDTFYQSEASGYNIGPYRAIQNVMSETGAPYKVMSSCGGLPGMTLLYI